MRTNFTIFMVFFGVALIDALRDGYWLRIVFWLAIAVVFLLADYRRKFVKGPRQEHQAGTHSG